MRTKLGGLGIALVLLAACGGGSHGSSAPSSAPRVEPRQVLRTDDPVSGLDPCVVGTWTSQEWALPGPAAALTAKGGSGAVLRVGANGRAEWDFAEMEPLTMHDPQIDLTTRIHTDGSATGRIAAADGTWTVTEADVSNIEGATEVSVGGSIPGDGAGAFMLLLDGAYTCTGDLLSYSTEQPATGGSLSIDMARK